MRESLLAGEDRVLSHDVSTWKDELVLFLDDASECANVCATQATLIATLTLSCKYGASRAEEIGH